MLDQLNAEAAGLGGNWVNLRTKAQGPSKARSFPSRCGTDLEGSVVFKKGTTTPARNGCSSSTAATRNP